jgi:hypothetical protein
MICLYLGASPPVGESVRTPRRASPTPLAPEQQWHPYPFPLRRHHEVLDWLSEDLAALALMEEEELAKQANQRESLSLLYSGGMRTSLFGVLMCVSGEGATACGGAGGTWPGPDGAELAGDGADGCRRSKLRKMGVGGRSLICPPWRSSRVVPPADVLKRGRRHRHHLQVVCTPQQQAHHKEWEKASPKGWRKTERRERVRLRLVHLIQFDLTGWEAVNRHPSQLYVEQ